MRLATARNLGLLMDDEETITQSVVTTTGIDAMINQYYRDRIAQTLIDKYPNDFVQKTYPRNTYRASFIVDGVSGTTLTATSPVFGNLDEGFNIQNPADGESIKIATYVSSTEVELESEPENEWAGDTCYTLNNVFIFDGDAEDLKEIMGVELMYSSTDTVPVVATRRNFKDVLPLNDQDVSKYSPYWYLTTQQEGGVNKRAIGMLPYPEAYDGKIALLYTQKPPVLANDSDNIQLLIAGVEETIILGVTAWGFRMLQDMNMSQIYQADYQASFQDLVKSYRPKSRSGPSIVRYSSLNQSILNRDD